VSLTTLMPVLAYVQQVIPETRTWVAILKDRKWMCCLVSCAKLL